LLGGSTPEDGISVTETKEKGEDKRMSSNNVLIIGLDGGTFDFLDPLIERGVMPRLGRIREEGCSGVLESSIPPFTIAAWPSFYTGLNPGKHGVISFHQRQIGGIHPERTGELVNGTHVRGERLWEALGAAGKKVGVINVPMTYPPTPINGFLISGMLTPPEASVYTYPAELANELSDYQIELSGLHHKDAFFRSTDLERSKETVEAIQRMAKQRTVTSLRLMREREWDFFMVVFTGTDRLCHLFWDYLGETDNGKKLDPEIQAALMTCYEQLDQHIGALIDQAGDQTTVLMMSDHGFGPGPKRIVFVNRWLEDFGLLQRNPTSGQRRSLKRLFELLRNSRAVRRGLRRLLPASGREKIRRATRENVAATIDWGRTRASFSLVYFNVVGIEINLIGARPDGIVSPDGEYEALRQQIMEAASDLVDPATGDRIVKQVYRREDIYCGPLTEAMPDIMIVFNPLYGASPSLLGQKIVQPVPPLGRKGDHRFNGIFFAWGPNIRTGRLSRPAQITDVMPTTLYLMEQPLPDNLDGQVIEEALAPDFLETHPITYRPATTPAEATGEAWQEGGLAAVTERLRDLGYLE
jgi:predicted AlkP superfamily phosphohydrolase/phosphomutase